MPLDDFAGRRVLHRATRTRRTAAQYKSPDGKYYQLPWKSNPVMIFYNKKAFAKAGIDTDQPAARHATPSSSTPPASSCRAAARSTRSARAVERVLPVLVRLLPALRRRDRRQAAGGGREGDVRRPDGHSRRRLLGSTMYDEKPGRQGDLQRRRVRRRQGRHGHRRPVGHRGLQGQGRLGRRCRCRPRRACPPTPSTPSATPRTSRCTPRARTVAPPGSSLKFATSQEQDGKLLELTGQMPHAAEPADHLRRLLHARTRPTRCSPTRRRAPSRCPTCRTRSRSGRPSGTPTLSR